MTNGWAAVVFHPHAKTPLVFHGTVPPKLLKHFASNKAFIYFLEAWAAIIITPILIKPLLTPTYIQLCDNDAATHAIIKGSGSHAPLNDLLGSHWTWHNRHCLRQILHRVPTHANIADPSAEETLQSPINSIGRSPNHQQADCWQRRRSSLEILNSHMRQDSPNTLISNNSNALPFRNCSLRTKPQAREPESRR